MSSDVCKHCTHAGCLDVCPTGALFRTEFGTVVVQDDVCNGCGTCVAGCPFGVVERRSDGTAAPTTERGERKGEQPDVPKRGVAQKCTLCYDRLVEDQTHLRSPPGGPTTRGKYSPAPPAEVTRSW
jgi:formate dehydrogenase iron-sulfur subunit